MSEKHINFPLVVICGGTGTGKSKLAIEIAKHYNGEVINADALQIYKGMDIATNKVTEDECMGVRHHLLGFESVEKLDYTIHDFQKAALDKITELKSQNKMPVLVGGTNYYIESILWHKLVDVRPPGNASNDKFDNMNNQDLHDYLRLNDPQTAKLLHPNERRKILRAIEISLNSYDNQSHHLETQLSTRRFALNETVFIWINSDNESLFPRLDKRVDAMVASGLLPELFEIQKLFVKLCPEQTYTRGIFQAIGFKEFHEYLNCTDKKSDVTQQILAQCVERLKTANKQYVKVQNKWITNRFLRQQSDERNIPLFKVNSSDVSQWNEVVLQRSLTIIEEIRNNTEALRYSAFVEQLHISPEPLSQSETFTSCYKVCESCDNLVFVSLQGWGAHIKGRRHERMKKRFKKIQTPINDKINVFNE